MSRLITQAKDGNLDGVIWELDNGASVNERDTGHDTALTWASYHGHAEVVRVLLERGADATVANVHGWTPLKLATRYGGAETAQLLQDHLEAPKTKPWVKLSNEAIANVENYPAIRQSLTHIFNFKTRERITIARNLDNTAQSMAPAVSFDSISRVALEEALAQFKKLGGTADEGYVLPGETGLSKPKIKAPGP